MKGWTNWPEYTGYYWFRKHNGKPKMICVYEHPTIDAIECWYCPGIKRFYQCNPIDDIWYRQVKGWKIK